MLKLNVINGSPDFSAQKYHGLELSPVSQGLKSEPADQVRLQYLASFQV